MRSEHQGDFDEIDVNIVEEQDLLEDLRKEMDLPEGVLVTNLFIPCSIVCSKTDLIEHGEREIKELLERNLDYIQMSLRKLCLHYGASLMFVSTNSNSNIQLTYEYVISRLYD